MFLDCSITLGGVCVPVEGREVEREEARRERVLVVSMCRRVARFLYLLFDDGPRPSEYGTCCGLGCFVFAISAHVVLFFGGCGNACCCSGGVAGGAWLAAVGTSWLSWFGGGGSIAGGIFVLFLRRMKLATG